MPEANRFDGGCRYKNLLSRSGPVTGKLSHPLFQVVEVVWVGTDNERKEHARKYQQKDHNNVIKRQQLAVKKEK